MGTERQVPNVQNGEMQMRIGDEPAKNHRNETDQQSEHHEWHGALLCRPGAADTFAVGVRRST